MNSTKRVAVMLGALVGALGGVAIALTLVRRAEEQGRENVISPGEGMRLGMLLVGLFQQIAALGDGE